MNMLSKETINLSVAEAHLQKPDEVNLLEYTFIDPKGAHHLVSHLDQGFLLLGIREIDYNSAVELKNFNGRVSMPNLTDFNSKTAELLASFETSVICNTSSGGEKIGNFLGPLNKESAVPIVEMATKTGVIHTSCYLSMDPEACREITSIPNPVIFGQIRSIDSYCAKILADKKNITFLNLTEIKSKEADFLVSKNCESLNLSCLRTIDPKLLEILLMSAIQFLNLDGIKYIETETGKLFASRRKHIFLSLNGLRTLSIELAQNLMQCGQEHTATGTLSLKGIEEISPKLGKVLCGYSGMLLTLSIHCRCDSETKKALLRKPKIRFS
jgi:hypothetical protein